MSLEKEKNFISAVVYVRNNARTLEAFLEHVYTQFDRLFSAFEIVCVNDASSDSSEDIIRAFGKEKAHAVSLVNMGYMQGTEMGMNAGEDLAIGDFVYEFDQAVQIWPDDMIKECEEAGILLL